MALPDGWPAYCADCCNYDAMTETCDVFTHWREDKLKNTVHGFFPIRDDEGNCRAYNVATRRCSARNCGREIIVGQGVRGRGKAQFCHVCAAERGLED